MALLNSRKILLAALGAGVHMASATLQVVPGATWTATNTGAHVQAHGAGIIQVGGTYYMIGEDKTNGTLFQHVNCYSSSNLVDWTYVGPLLSVNDVTGSDLGPNRIVERPKVIYNDATGKYVLYMHIDNTSYGEAKVGVAIGNSVCGTYQYLGSWNPLGFQSRDMGLFKDDDGSAYLLSEDRANGLRIDALTDDYLNVTETTYLWSDHIEAPAILKHGGYYFMFGSHLTGWSPNDNVYSYATSLSGPWSAWATFATVGSNTYNSQTNYILPLGDTAIYMGDRWVSTNLVRSTYIWLPLTISGTTITMANRVNWVPQVSSGTWSVAPGETWPEAENQTLANGAVVLSCSGCSGGEDVGYIGGSSNGKVTFSGVQSDATTTSTLRINYANGDTAQRYAVVTCNGVAHNVAFLPTGSGQTVASSVVNCALTAGTSNVIVVNTANGNWGPDLDRIMIPLS